MTNTMENKFCLVTSLFNIERERMNGNDGRSWDDYLKWFEKTLKLKTPMIVFCEDDLVEFIEKRREYPTKIITHTVSEIPYYYLKDEIQKIISSNAKGRVTTPSKSLRVFFARFLYFRFNSF